MVDLYLLYILLAKFNLIGIITECNDDIIFTVLKKFKNVFVDIVKGNFSLVRDTACDIRYIQYLNNFILEKYFVLYFLKKCYHYEQL